MQFGVQLAPVAKDIEDVRALARLADAEGLDLLGVQDHPYAESLVDTFAFMSTVLTETTSIKVFPDVASLPMRGPAMLGKISATLDVLSGGRFELGLGSGAFWPAITAMGGGPARTSAEALRATEEAVEIIRGMWKPGRPVKVDGEFYQVKGVHAGPAPVHEVGIWLGTVGPKANALTGRIADGWAAPIPAYLPYEKWRATQDIIDRAAVDAGRDPSDVMRMAQLVGHITDTPGALPREGADAIHATAEQWAAYLADLCVETGFDTFVYWPESATEDQILRWSREVVPATRALLDKR